MTNKHVAMLVKNVSQNVDWASWDESSRRLLAGALSPMVGMTNSQKGAKPQQWEAVRLSRHLFGSGRLPLPSFVIKQWISIPDLEKSYWAAMGAEASPVIIQETDKKIKIASVKDA